ncbi:hypothetical protein EON65_47560 [archaeon]|nr:MAG: hypothetical protein EON65_47560 [archaeon]
MEHDPNLYEAATTVKLEQAVAQQLQSRSYDLQSNKALFKNYLVNASHVKVDVVCNVLVLGLMRLPNKDFTVLLNLLPVKCIGDASVTAIRESAALLEKGKYAEFWEEYVNHESLFNSASGFANSIRLFILGNLRDSYKAMPKALFAQCVGVEEESMSVFCQGNKFIEKLTDVHVHFAMDAEEASKSASVAPSSLVKTDEVASF